MEKIKLVLGILLGFTLSFFNACLLKNSTTKTDEQYIVTNSRDVFILDSVEFKLTSQLQHLERMIIIVPTSAIATW